jgi:hypothetical protein
MRKGSALLSVIIIFSILFILAGLLTKIVYNNYSSTNAALMREQAFYLAEAGLEKGKVELTHNPNWHTDLPYYISDNIQWLITYASGDKNDLGEGSFKVVREKGKNRLYSIGIKGKGIVVLKLEFSSPPFKSLKWKEL